MMHRFINKALGFLASASLILQLGAIQAYAQPAWPSDTGIMAEAGIVVDMDSGAVLFGQQIHVAYPPASIAKLLTALVVAENSSMDEMVEFTEDAVYNVESGSGNKLNMETGDKLSVEDCLYMLLLVSSNQAGNALAEHVAGSRDKFVDMMNQKLVELGCVESRFANPSGLNDDNQYVSAYDMAIIARAAFENEKILEISSSRKHSIPATSNNPNGASFTMEHRLLVTEDTGSQYFCEGAIAGKTGYTSKAGNTLVTYASRNGRNQISVILKGTQPQYYLDSRTILDFGFASFKNMNISEHETFLRDQESIQLGETTYPVSDLSMDSAAVITLPGTAEFTDAERALVTDLPGDRPEGAVALLQYTYNERKIGSAYIYSAAASASAAAAAAAETGPADPAGQPETTVPEAGETEGDSKEAVSPSGEFRMGSIWKPAAALLVAAGIAAGLAFYLKEKRRREMEERERRRERRRQRLLESGCTQEEFDRLLELRIRSREGGKERGGGRSTQ